MGKVEFRTRSRSTPPPDQADQICSNTRVLYVDDNPDAQRIFVRELRHCPLLIDLASSGQEAIDLVDKNNYAVIATDLEMPGMSGIELIERLHAAATPASFILVTGVVALNLPTTSESARSITCVVSKPWDVGELENAVRRGIKLHCNRTVQKVTTDERPKAARLLLIEDSLGDAKLIQKMLYRAARNKYSVVHVERLSEAIAMLEQESFELILVDLSLPDARGMDGVTRLQAIVPEIPVVVMSGLSDEELAVQAVQHGAQDYLVKGEVDGRFLHRSIRYAMERKATEQRLAYLAHYDQLTGLANRTAFRQYVSQALSRAHRSSSTTSPAILLLDLDRFKTVNDTLGHDIGDQLLSAVADRITSAVRNSDMVARLGGDEFAVLIDDIKKEEQLATPAQRIIEALGAPLSLEGHELHVTTSIGIAIFPENGDSIEELLKNADSAMYRAKENGRNNYQFFDHEMHSRALHRMQLERDLRCALEREEFTIYYQPLSSCRSGHPVCFEALLRWQHPRLGLIQPDEFIPLLEDLGLIVPVGEWVLQKTCAQIRQWQEKYGEHLRIAVNVSPRQFDDPGLVQAVTTALRSADVSAGSLELEVTENLVMRDIDVAVTTLQSLKALGVRIAVDDFGTGQSQLVYLVRFPIDTLKIDKSVTQMIGSTDGNVVTKTVIDMGHNLGLEVVAEGVEETSQLDFLTEQGCDTFQGYLAARPLAREDCENWLAKSVCVDNKAALTSV